MRWNYAYAGLILLFHNFVNESEAFTQTPPKLEGISCLRRLYRNVGIGPAGIWDNGYSLNTLSASGSVDDLPDPGENLGAGLTKDTIEEVKARNEKDEGGGGSRFKEMMAKAQSGGMMPNRPSGSSTPPINPYALDPYAGTEFRASSPPSPPPTSAPDLQNMSDAEQARMFREMMQQQQKQQSYAPPPPPPKIPIDPTGRKVGRNRDADAIQNTGDLYFAQLKRDSSLRNIARQRGDYEKAEAVFEDKSIKELENLMYNNPYLKDKKEKEKEVLDNSIDELVAMKAAEARRAAQGNSVSSGISYKEKMKRRNNKQHRNSSQSKETEETVPSLQVESKAANTVNEVVISKSTEPSVPTEEVKELTKSGSTKEIVVSPPPPPTPVVATVTATTTGPSFANQNSEEQRKSLRTIMGLLLKHRGGEGFGSGGLKGPDIERFENLFTEITAALKEEASLSVSDLSASPPRPEKVNQIQEIAAVPSTISSPPKIEVTPPMVTMSTSPKTNFAQEGPSEVNTEEDPIERALKCIEGASQMYRNSPAELKSGVRVSLRDALLSAVQMCNKAIAEN